MSEEKEYIKIEIGTFYRFVETLELLVEFSDIKNDNGEYLLDRLKDFEYEVLHDGELRVED